ncbi:hypothetical protein F5Y01DRAFT_297164 [Xylaria sp. FL0043]|nr:hypothetical protein F5Y01DRAFT_297164 [Xylaria sp. FL0043]
MKLFSLKQCKYGEGRDDNYGFKILWESENSIVDIVFIHGLMGDRERTWTAHGSDKPWPQSLLPSKIKNARILTYGYDANTVKLTEVVSSNRIGDHASTFLAALATARDTDEQARHRPIIFVAHSLGGLVCQDALHAAATSNSEHRRRIVECTRGIAFLGTPLTGSGFAAAAERLARCLGIVRNTNWRILSVLRRDSEVADRIQRDFNYLLESRTHDSPSKINVACFYEELPLEGIGERVVNQQAATHHPWESIGLHKNHMEMARFASEADSGFVLFVGTLKRWVDSLQSVDEAPQQMPPMQYKIVEPRRPSPGPQEQSRSSDGSKFGVSVGGSVTASSIVGGSQTVHGPLTIGPV